MSTSTTPIRLDAELTLAAKEAAARMSRSAAEQISHWARIGRELERSAEISVADIGKVLAGQRSYDALPPREQAIVRAAWTERMEAVRGRLRLDKTFEAEGHAYAELDASGNVVVHEPVKPAARKGRSRR